MSPSDYLKKPYARLLVPEADGSYRAEIAEFPGCIALGDTAGEAIAMLEEVAESWLMSALDKGQQIPEPLEEIGFSGKLVVRLPKSLHRKAAYAAKRDGASLNQFIVNAVSEQVGIRASITTVFNTAVFQISRAPIQTLRSDSRMQWQSTNRVVVENSFSTGQQLVSHTGGKNA